MGPDKQRRNSTVVACQHCSPDERGGQPGRIKENKLRPIALLVTPLKLIESVAVDQHADHIIALMQEQQVGFRVRDGVEVMINAVRKFLKNDTNRILMQGDNANAYGSINRLSVLEAVGETHPLPGPAVCLTIRERWNSCGESRERREREEVRATLQCSERCLPKEHTEQRDILPDLLEQMTEVMEQTNRERLVRRRLHSEL